MAPFQVSVTRVTRSSWFLLVCSCFKFIFIKSWNFNRNENGEASPWCSGLLWDTRWVSVLVVIFPANSLFYRRVIDGSASFGDICKDQMASVSRRVPLLLIDVLCVNSCSFHQYFLALSLFWGWWTWMKLYLTHVVGVTFPSTLLTRVSVAYAHCVLGTSGWQLIHWQWLHGCWSYWWMASYCLVNLVCRDYQLWFTLVFWLFAWASAIWSYGPIMLPYQILNFASWFGLRLPLVICWIL